MSFRGLLAAAAAILVSCGLTACGGGGGDQTTTPPPTPQTHVIGGSITGLSEPGLVLQDNGGDNLTVPSRTTSFTFATPIAAGGAYSVTVMTSPANTTCSIAQGSGTVAAADITNITVTCTANSGTSTTYTIGGTISGLTGSGLVLSLNSGNSLLTVAASAQVFTFARTLATGSTFAVTVQVQPTNETCTVMNGTGTVGSASVTNVVVSCSGHFVYVTNATDGTSGDVSQFTIDPATGALRAIASGKVTADTKPSGIAINYAVPNTPEVYVANATSADVTDFAFFTTSAGGSTPGALFGPINTPILDPNNTSIPNKPAAIAVAPSGAFLFAGGSGTAAPQEAIYGFALDKAGNLSTAANSTTVTGGPVSGLTVDPSSTLLFATISVANQVDIYSIASGAALTAVANSPFATGKNPQGVAAWPKNTPTAGVVYTANQGDNTISAFPYGTSQGSLQLQPATAYSTGQAPVGITIDPTGTYLYAANSGDGTVSAFSINQSTGALTALGAAVASGNLNPTLHANPGPVDLKVDPSGKYLYCVNGIDGSVSLFTVSAGALTLSNTYATGAGAMAVAIY